MLVFAETMTLHPRIHPIFIRKLDFEHKKLVKGQISDFTKLDFSY